MKLHLGCGRNVMPGWINLDLEPSSPEVIQWKAPLLPYPDNSVDFIYSEHFIEHIEYEECRKLFQEAKRVLRYGGVMRVSTPYIGTIFIDWESNRMEKYSEKGITFKSSAHFVNQAFRDWGHKFIYDFECLQALWENSFVYSLFYGDSAYEEFKKIETRPDFGDLIAELRK